MADHDDLDSHAAESLKGHPRFAGARARLQATPALDPDVDDPDGMVTCICGDEFTGANFVDRMRQWREHTEAAHAD